MKSNKFLKQYPQLWRPKIGDKVKVSLTNKDTYYGFDIEIGRIFKIYNDDRYLVEFKPGQRFTYNKDRLMPHE